MLLLQQFYFPVHFCTGKKINNHLSILGYIFGKLFLIRRLDSHNHLWRRIRVTGILEFSLSIDVLNIHNNDVAEQTGTTVKILRTNSRNPERTFRLGQSRYIGIKYMEKRTIHT